MKKKTRERLRIAWILSLLLIFAVVVGIIGYHAFHLTKSEKKAHVNVATGTSRLDKLMGSRVQKKLLAINKFSRPGISLSSVKSVVIHYTANPGASATANRNYFNNLLENNSKLVKPVYASSNFIIGIQGEILCVVPPNEVAYASNWRNNDSLSIECCHVDSTGKFNSNTYQSAVWLTACICKAYKLDEEDIIRHYDITGKNCPKYFVEHIEAWGKFKKDVMAQVKELS